jgi:hypothetical protein
MTMTTHSHKHWTDKGGHVSVESISVDAVLIQTTSG